MKLVICFSSYGYSTAHRLPILLYKSSLFHPDNHICSLNNPKIILLLHCHRHIVFCSSVLTSRSLRKASGTPALFYIESSGWGPLLPLNWHTFHLRRHTRLKKTFPRPHRMQPSPHWPRILMRLLSEPLCGVDIYALLHREKNSLSRQPQHTLKNGLA